MRSLWYSDRETLVRRVRTLALLVARETKDRPLGTLDMGLSKGPEVAVILHLLMYTPDPTRDGGLPTEPSVEVAP